MGLPNSNPPSCEHLFVISRHYRPLDGLYADVEARMINVDSGISAARERLREFGRIMQGHEDRCTAAENRIRNLRTQFADIDREVSNLMQRVSEGEFIIDGEGLESGEEVIDNENRCAAHSAGEEDMAKGFENVSRTRHLSGEIEPPPYCDSNVIQTVHSSNYHRNELSHVTIDERRIECKETSEGRKSQAIRSVESNNSEPPAASDANDTIVNNPDTHRGYQCDHDIKTETENRLEENSRYGNRSIVSNGDMKQAYMNKSSSNYTNSPSQNANLSISKSLPTQSCVETNDTEKVVMDIIRKYTEGYVHVLDSNEAVISVEHIDEQNTVTVEDHVVESRDVQIDVTSVDDNSETHLAATNTDDHTRRNYSKGRSLSSVINRHSQMVIGNHGNEATTVTSTLHHQSQIVGVNIQTTTDVDVAVRFHGNTGNNVDCQNTIPPRSGIAREFSSTNQRYCHTSQQNLKTSSDDDVKVTSQGIQTDILKISLKKSQTETAKSTQKECQTESAMFRANHCQTDTLRDVRMMPRSDSDELDLSDNTSLWSSIGSQSSNSEDNNSHISDVESPAKSSDSSCRSNKTYTIASNHGNYTPSNDSESSLDADLSHDCGDHICKYCGHDVTSHSMTSYSAWIARQNLLNHEFEGIQEYDVTVQDNDENITETDGYHSELNNKSDNVDVNNMPKGRNLYDPQESYTLTDNIQTIHSLRCFTSPHQVNSEVCSAPPGHDEDLDRPSSGRQDDVMRSSQDTVKSKKEKPTTRRRECFQDLSSDDVTRRYDGITQTEISSEQIVSTYTKRQLRRYFSDEHSPGANNGNHLEPVKFNAEIHKRSANLVESVRNGTVIYPKAVKAYVTNVSQVVTCHKMMSSESRMSAVIDGQGVAESLQCNGQDAIKSGDADKDINTSSITGSCNPGHRSNRDHGNHGHCSNRDHRQREDPSQDSSDVPNTTDRESRMESVLAVYANRFLEIMKAHTEREMARKYGTGCESQDGEPSSYFPNAQEHYKVKSEERIRNYFCKKLGFKPSMLSIIEEFYSSKQEKGSDMTFDPRHANDDDVKKFLMWLDANSIDKLHREALRVAIATVHVFLQHSSFSQ